MKIKFENINFKYGKREEYILKNLNLYIGNKEITAIVGESGCGKSTILRLIAGFEKPESGVITNDGKILAGNGIFIQPEKRNIGMVFQDYALFPHMTVEKNIAFGIQNKNAAEKREIVEKMSKIVRLEEYGKRYPYQLSGGQQQRVALARALAGSPGLLLMDEPFSNLDKHLKDEIRSEIKAIIKAVNITTVIVTHDSEDADFLCDRVISITKGSGPA